MIVGTGDIIWPGAKVITRTEIFERWGFRPFIFRIHRERMSKLRVRRIENVERKKKGTLL